MTSPGVLKVYKEDNISLQHNNKTGEVGTIDILRGCKGCELKNAPCYAAKGARRLGINFFQPIRRRFDESLLEKQLKKYKIDWVRIGCISDPSLDWQTTTTVSEILHRLDKTPVIITKCFEVPTEDILKQLQKSNAHLQISLAGITPRRQKEIRKSVALVAKDNNLPIRWRINSAIWGNTKARDTQEELISFALENEISIIDTPIRLFRTSPLWNHVDQKSYHRHLSPLSGKLDNQRTAGLIIPNAYPCYSTCADGPKNNDSVGCPHQCVTRI